MCVCLKVSMSFAVGRFAVKFRILLRILEAAGVMFVIF